MTADSEPLKQEEAEQTIKYYPLKKRRASMTKLRVISSRWQKYRCFFDLSCTFKFFKNKGGPLFIATLFIRRKRWKNPSVHQQMNREIKCSLSTHNRIFIIQPLRRKEILTCHNMNEPWRHHAKWNKPVNKGQVLYDFTYQIREYSNS